MRPRSSYREKTEGLQINQGEFHEPQDFLSDKKLDAFLVCLRDSICCNSGKRQNQGTIPLSYITMLSFQML